MSLYTYGPESLVEHTRDLAATMQLDCPQEDENEFEASIGRLQLYNIGGRSGSFETFSFSPSSEGLGYLMLKSSSETKFPPVSAGLG
jgi:hypothetical protein